MDLDFTREKLAQLIPDNPHIDTWYDALTATARDSDDSLLDHYQINTVNRLAAFLAQCIHESAGFATIKENLNYRAESLRRVFPKYFPTDDLAQKYAHNQSMIANRVYGNRMGNGPEESGDGYKFCGRGLIQLTGHDNYLAFANSIDMDIDDVVEYLSTFNGAVESAAWFWDSRNLNYLADQDNIKEITHKINGGYIGLEERTALYQKAKSILGT